MADLEKYPFTKDIEAAVAVATATRPRFFELIGHALEADRMTTRAANLLVMAAQRVARKIGGPCHSLALAMQELKCLHYEGKVTHEDIVAAVDLADVADSAGQLDIEALVAASQEPVQRIHYRQAMADALRATKTGNAAEVAERFEKVAAVGRAGGDHGDAMSGTVHDIVQATTSNLEAPLGLGVPELDDKLCGGLERRGVGVMVAGTGVAKSMFLCHAAAEAIWRHKSTVYVTLELSPGTVKSRIYRNLTGMTEAEIKAHPEECERRWKMLREAGVGSIRVVRRNAHETTIGNIRGWLRDLERETTMKPEVLLIDPVDDLVDKVGTMRKGFDILNQVFVKLRDLAEEGGMYIWCASQAVRGKNRGQKILVDDVSDGMAKVRKATLVLGAYRTDEDEESGELRWNVAKRTAIETVGAVGPLRHDFDRGRVARVVRAGLPWEVTT